MLSAMFAGAVRHRRLVLIGAVAVMSGVVGLALLLHGFGRALVTLLISFLVVLLAVLTLVAHFRPRQAAFVVDPHTPAFRTPPHESQLFFAIMVISVSAETVLIRSSGPGLAEGPVALLLRLEDAVLTVLSAALIALTAVHIVLAWRGTGVQLRPDGLIDRTGVGTLTVPWEALAPDYALLPPPKATRIALTLTRPELVRRRGLVFWSSIQANNVDTVFLAHAIRFYAANPDHRPSIGTRAEYGELLRAVPGSMARRHPENLLDGDLRDGPGSGPDVSQRG